MEDTYFSIICVESFTTVPFEVMVLNHKTSHALIPLMETPQSVPIMVGMTLLLQGLHEILRQNSVFDQNSACSLLRHGRLRYFLML